MQSRHRGHLIVLGLPRRRLHRRRRQPASREARLRHRPGRTDAAGRIDGDAQSGAADAHLLAEIVRLDRAHHRPLAGDSEEAEAIKLVARTHQSLIWDRSRQVLRLRSALRDFFPAALKAFPDLDAPDALELLAAAPDPDKAARLSRARIAAALRRANRRNIDARASEIRQILRAEELQRSPAVQAAYAAIVASQAGTVQTLNAQIEEMAAVVDAHFGRHPDAEIYASQPRLGVVLAARVLGEFGDDRTATPTPERARTTPAPPRSPAPRARRRSSSLATPVTAELRDELQHWAFCALRGSPGARAYHQQLRARNIGHHAALRQVANRLVGILHGCLKTHTPYDEHTAWSHHMTHAA